MYLYNVLIPVVAIIAVFVFVAVAVWSDNRRRERETFHKHETYRKMLDASAERAAAVANMMRREDARREQRKVDGLRLGGLITMAAGVGVAALLFLITDGREPIWVVGVIPFLIGAVLAFVGFFGRRREPSEGSQP